jgi:hypothetical protein
MPDTESVARAEAPRAAPPAVKLRPHQQRAYHRGMVLLLEAHEVLAQVKTAGWTQAVVLNEVFSTLERAAESLMDIGPNDLSSDVREIVGRWTNE